MKNLDEKINGAQEKGNRHFKGNNMFFSSWKPSLELESCYYNFGTRGL